MKINSSIKNNNAAKNDQLQKKKKTYRNATEIECLDLCFESNP